MAMLLTDMWEDWLIVTEMTDLLSKDAGLALFMSSLFSSWRSGQMGGEGRVHFSLMMRGWVWVSNEWTGLSSTYRSERTVVFNPGPGNPAHFLCLPYWTHLIQIISSLEERAPWTEPKSLEPKRRHSDTFCATVTRWRSGSAAAIMGWKY